MDCSNYQGKCNINYISNNKMFKISKPCFKELCNSIKNNSFGFSDIKKINEEHNDGSPKKSYYIIRENCKDSMMKDINDAGYSVFVSTDTIHSFIAK